MNTMALSEIVLDSGVHKYIYCLLIWVPWQKTLWLDLHCPITINY